MLYVILRPEQDAALDIKTGLAVKHQFRGHHLPPIEDDILPNGGIVLKEIKVSTPNYRVSVGPNPDVPNIGMEQEQTRLVFRERQVIRKEEGDGLDPFGNPLPVYVCIPTEDDAKHIANSRFGWTYIAVGDESQIQRRRDLAPTPDSTQVQHHMQVAVAPEEGEAEVTTELAETEREQLKAKVRLLLGWGAPNTKLSNGNDILKAYVAKHWERFSGDNDIGTGTGAAIPEGGGEANGAESRDVRVPGAV